MAEAGGRDDTRPPAPDHDDGVDAMEATTSAGDAGTQHESQPAAPQLGAGRDQCLPAGRPPLPPLPGGGAPLSGPGATHGSLTHGSLVGVRFPEALLPEVVATLASLHELAGGGGGAAGSANQALLSTQVRDTLAGKHAPSGSWMDGYMHSCTGTKKLNELQRNDPHMLKRCAFPTGALTLCASVLPPLPSLPHPSLVTACHVGVEPMKGRRAHAGAAAAAAAAAARRTRGGQQQGSRGAPHACGQALPGQGIQVRRARRPYCNNVYNRNPSDNLLWVMQQKQQLEQCIHTWMYL